MKWITHQTAGVGAALALHLPLEGVVAACLGAILPDKLDQAIAKRSRNPQRTFNQIHRGTTHWFGWWVAILLVACSHLVPPHWQPALLGIGLGGISHVVLDMLTPSGIPLHPFSRKNKLSFKVCSTGSVGEYVFLGVMLVLLGFLLGPEMKELIRHVRQQLRCRVQSFKGLRSLRCLAHLPCLLFHVCGPCGTLSLLHHPTNRQIKDEQSCAYPKKRGHPRIIKYHHHSKHKSGN